MRRRRLPYRRNPSLIIYNPPPWVQEVLPPGATVEQCISEDVHEIKYQHSDDGEWYSHKFDPGVDLFAIRGPNGQHNILIVGQDGQNVWEDYE
jgi:hypothetical protein